jgi:DUF971 family protein
MNASDNTPIVPMGLVADQATDQLLIEWNDGVTTRYPIEWLRWQCPCALCRGEMGVPGRLSHVKTLTTDETRLEDAQPIGRYGIMLYWGDGHHDGIFTYDWLRNNSPDEAAPAEPLTDV